MPKKVTKHPAVITAGCFVINGIALIDSAGIVVVKYVYDAWGNHAVLDANGNDISDGNHIGNLNPFRYRGYFYDVETELYYLQTRYYDPEVGRFITIDGIEYLDPESINGLNLYAYCGDNPVMFTDPNGTFFLSLLIGALIAGAIAGTIKAVSTAVNGGSFLDCLGSFVGGFIVGAVLGAASILGGGLVVGAFSATALSIAGTAAFLTVGTFGAGMFAYAAENAIKGSEIKMDELFKSGAITMIQGLFSFGMGAVMGAGGFYESLKPGNGLADIIKSSKDYFKMEVGKLGATGIVQGAKSYLSTNIGAMFIRTFLKNIFTAPWNLIKP